MCIDSKSKDAVARCIFLWAFLLLGHSCTRRKPLEDKSSSRERPTATELFNLRSKCTELGDALLKSKGIDADFTSRYDLSSNRCYVRVSHSVAGSTFEGVFDGQTRKVIASVTINRNGYSDGIVATGCPGPKGSDCISAAESKMDELMWEEPADKK
jgi:hypothetical protein